VISSGVSAPDRSRHSAAFLPGTVEAGTVGCWVVRVVLGHGGAGPGSMIAVQLPDSWHAGNYSGAKGLHAIDGTAPNFISARSSRAGVHLLCRVPDGTTDDFVVTRRTGVDGRVARHIWVVEVDVVSGDLDEGDFIEVLYGDQTQGGGGYEAALHPDGPERILVSVRTSLDGETFVISPEDGAWAIVEAAAPVEVVATLPSTVASGESATLHIAVFDRFANLVTDFDGEITLSVRSGSAEVSLEVRLTPEDGGVVEIGVSDPAGIVRIATANEGLGETLSNPMEVVSDAAAPRLYWGDLHSHAADSFDGRGRSPFTYARTAANLDFYALSEHGESWDEDVWPRVKKRINDHNDPGRFVTIVAYEATFGAPWGHHNVYFLGDDGPLVTRDNGTLLDLWDAIEAGTAITIPHHTGVEWRVHQQVESSLLAPSPDWDYHDAERRRLIEIYSLHGLSETFNPDHPLAYENSHHTWARSADGPFYATDAWAAGLQLGVIASSDDHAAQPGRPDGGLAAVWCDELERSDVFHALYRRHTYGTTGSRMIIRFTMNGVEMGQVAPFASSTQVEVVVHGTSPLEVVELVRQEDESGSIEVVMSWDPDGYDLTASWDDYDSSDGGLYYVRVQESGKRRGRAIMGWSSPIWCSPHGNNIPAVRPR